MFSIAQGSKDSDLYGCESVVQIVAAGRSGKIHESKVFGRACSAKERSISSEVEPACSR
jgi:hypothetical protein